MASVSNSPSTATDTESFSNVIVGAAFVSATSFVDVVVATSVLVVEDVVHP